MAEPCHCGKPMHRHDDGFTRGLCLNCDLVRCDAYPGACKQTAPTLDAGAGVVERLAEVLAQHEADVTSYDAGDLHGCQCGWEVPRDIPVDPVMGWADKWPSYHRHVAEAVDAAQRRSEAPRSDSDGSAGVVGRSEGWEVF